LGEICQQGLLGNGIERIIMLRVSGALARGRQEVAGSIPAGCTSGVVGNFTYGYFMNMQDIIIPLIKGIIGIKEHNVTRFGVYEFNFTEKPLRSLYVTFDGRINFWATGIETYNMDEIFWKCELKDPDVLDDMKTKLIKLREMVDADILRLMETN
jgi:hypothetical protein